MKLLHKRNANYMTMKEHVHELRHRIFSTFIIIVALFIYLYGHSNSIIDFLTEMGKEFGYKFVYISPQEVLIQQLRVSLVLALLLSLPIILYQIIAYLAPIFSEDKFFKAIAFMNCSTLIGLLFIGMYFAYDVMLPFTYKFLYSIGEAAGIASSVSIEKYISLFLTLVVCIGIVFELPLACICLTRMGVVTAEGLKRGRKLIVVIAFVIGAIITPPDVISQAMVAIPIIVLYQISIILCSIIGKERKA